MPLLCVADYPSTTGFFAQLCDRLPGARAIYVDRDWDCPCAPADVDDADVLSIIASDLRAARLTMQGQPLRDEIDRITARARRVLSYVDRLIAPDDTLLVWGGFPHTLAAAAHVARRNGCKVLYGENGTIPCSWACGTGGVNGASDFARRPADDFRARDVDRERLDALYANGWEQRPMLAHTAVGDALPDGDYVLYGGQVQLDTQLTALSPRYPSLVSAVCATWDAIQRHNARRRQSLQLVVKAHPYDIDTTMSLLKAVLPEVPVLVETPIRELLTDPHCRALVTINSSVGLEAVALGVPVVTLGRSIYDVLAHPALGSTIDRALYSALHEARDQQLIDGYLDAMLSDHLIDLTPVGAEGADKYDLIASRLEDLLHGTP